MLMFTLACALFGDRDAPQSPAPPSPTAPAADSDHVFVQASVLNLRRAPDGDKLGTVSINSPLTVLERQPDWVKVRVGNGSEGWVGAVFVAPKPLTRQDAVAGAQREPEQALSWWQRAAAIDPDREVLTGLRDAYTAAGKPDQAAQVQAQLDWPHTLHLVWNLGSDDELTTTSQVHWSVADFGVSAQHRTFPRDTWTRHGLEPDGPWWVLPSLGPAVPAKVTGFERLLLNECSGEVGYRVTLEHAPLSEGTVALVASRGTPPATWSSDQHPKHDRAMATQAILEALEGRGDTAPILRIAPDGTEHWSGHAYFETGEYGELGNAILEEIPVHWNVEGVTLGTPEITGVMQEVAAYRQVTGTRRPQMVLRDSCEVGVYDLDDLALQVTPTLCCGC